ncbi:MAG TPA: UDP-N-acetylmuramoyl-L-alanyl-D-glutamate--2,6-diaminopimelate ligase [Nitrospiraceae bacterium]|nr:UDP-N-acetylmuramoyl-L-alanyl-D-glutamate--2,6-diaminopimelate ligase [Nitrospiraceae bacterium]
MTLDDLIAPLEKQGEVTQQRGEGHIHITSLADDSRQITPGTLFVAVKGERADGHAYVHQAVAAGAAALVVQDAAVVRDQPVPTIAVRDSRRALGLLAARLLNDPSMHLRMIGVTGTNGKTTTTYLVKALLESAKRHVGLIGTVSYEIGSERIDASHTTPGAVELQQLLARMVEAGMDAVAMEVSSHALAMERTSGCEYDTAVFTNLTQDHLDYHRTMEEYFKSKLRLFTGLTTTGKKSGRKRAIVNADDPWASRITQACPVPVWTYSIREASDIRAHDVRLSVNGTTFRAVTPNGDCQIDSLLIGEHNVSNALAAIGVGLNEGLSLDIIREGIRAVRNVPGRFERVEAGQDFTIVVDYAHTEDALVRLLTAAHALKTGRIITVFGCGGDRDRGKRPKMGRAATKHSDVVILTSDNPRTEDPMAILQEVEAGVRDALEAGRVRYEMIPDRRTAIETAVREAKRGDMVLIAGKGHEDYQIIGKQKFHFDDREVAREAVGKLVR